jgi:lipoate-protein ligase B
MTPWFWVDIPSMDYQDALELQRALVNAKITGALSRDVVLLLEHPHVFTVGRRGSRENLLAAEDFLESRKIRVMHVERGGDITYHGPGQLVVYPIIDLKGIRWRVTDFVQASEDVMIRAVAEWGIAAGRNSMNRGVWVGNAKIGNVGIAVRKGISFHGFALNVNVSTEPFGWINPCGLKEIQVASMEQVLAGEIPIDQVRQVVVRHIQEVFGVELQKVSLEDIHCLLPVHTPKVGRLPNRVQV